MNASEIRLAFGTWKLLNRKHTLTGARFERFAKKEPLSKVIALVQDTFGVHIESDKENNTFHMKETEAKARVVRNAPAKKAAPTKVAAKKTATAKSAPTLAGAGASVAMAKRR